MKLQRKLHHLHLQHKYTGEFEIELVDPAPPEPAAVGANAIDPPTAPAPPPPSSGIIWIRSCY